MEMDNPELRLPLSLSKHVECGERSEPHPTALPTAVGINLPAKTQHAQGEREASTVNSPQPVSHRV